MLQIRSRSSTSSDLIEQNPFLYAQLFWDFSCGQDVVKLTTQIATTPLKNKFSKCSQK